MIGIIVAEEKELIEVQNVMTDIKEKQVYEKVFYLGKIEEKEVVLGRANIGKVNSARLAQILIDKFNVELVINVGSAGSVDNRLNIGDVVVATKLVQHDFDITPFGRKLGEIDNVGQYIEVKKELLDLINDRKVFKGIIASGDKFVHILEEKEKIRDTFNALCVEMEGASIAQVCFLDNIPFLIIRSITDKLDGTSKVEYDKFLSSSSKEAARILKEFIKEYKKAR